MGWKDCKHLSDHEIVKWRNLWEYAASSSFLSNLCVPRRQNHIRFCSPPQTQNKEHHLAHSRCSINTENKGIKEFSDARVEGTSRAHTINTFTHTFTPSFCKYCTFSCTGHESMKTLTESVCIHWIVKGSRGGWSSWKHPHPAEMESCSSWHSLDFRTAMHLWIWFLNPFLSSPVDTFLLAV